MITFPCEYCSSSVTARDEHAGQRVRCPQCSQPASVPVVMPLPPNMPAQSFRAHDGRPKIADWIFAGGFAFLGFLFIVDGLSGIAGESQRPVLLVIAGVLMMGLGFLIEIAARLRR